MRRAIALAVVLVLVLALPASAQSPVPAPPWPTVDELRRDLRDIGWSWGASGTVWEGGRRVFGATAGVSALMSGSPDGLRVSVVVAADELDSRWPMNVDSDWTAIMEIVARLPVDDQTRFLVWKQIFLDEADCIDYPLHGGMLTVTKLDADFIELFRVAIVQSGTAECPETTSTLAPTPVPTPVPTGLGEMVGVSLQEWQLEPGELTLTAGTYTFAATNDGSIDHALKIEGEGIELQTPDKFYGPGVTESFTVGLAPGAYELFCPVAGHKDAGMTATVTVR